MSLENNKELVRRFYDLLAEGEYEKLTDIIHKDFTFYSQVDTPRPGADGFIAAERHHLDAFDNIRVATETVAEGDRVVAYVVFEGDQVKELFGIPPAGAHLRMSMCNIFRIKDGKIIEKRAHYDRLDHLEQLRAKPANGTSA